MKKQTTVLIEEDLRNLAKARKVSMSGILEESLRIHLALPNTAEELKIRQNHLKNELSAVNAKLQEFEAMERIQQKKDALTVLREDVAQMRAERRKWMEDPKLRSGMWGKAMNAFMKKYKMDRAEALSLIETGGGF